jgi:Arc/MetJ family transcription regulator
MMLTRVSVDSKLLAAAMAITGFRTKRATVEYALWVYIRTKDPQAALELRETLNWSREVAAKFRAELC